MTTDTTAPTNPQTISNANSTHDIEQGPDSYNTTDLNKAAHREGFIYIDDLVVVFARETWFTQKHLPGLWEKFGCERRRGPIGDLSNQSQRFKRWFTVLYRLAFGFADHPGADDSLTRHGGRKLVKKYIQYGDGYLPATRGNLILTCKDGKLRESLIKDSNGLAGGLFATFDDFSNLRHVCFFGLDDLRDYLTGYAGIPAEDLPGSLFPPVVTSEESTGQGPGEATLSHDVLKNKDQGRGLENQFAISNEIGLIWSDVKATFISDVELLFQFKNTGVTRNYANLGFQDQRTKRPIGAWSVLAEASKTGKIPWQYENRVTAEKKAQEIRKKIRALFPGIDGDPVPIGKNKAERSYHFAFDLKNNTQMVEDDVEFPG